MWQQLHELLPAELNAVGALDWSKAVIDSSHVRAAKAASTKYLGVPPVGRRQRMDGVILAAT